MFYIYNTEATHAGVVLLIVKLLKKIYKYYYEFNFNYTLLSCFNSLSI